MNSRAKGKRAERTVAKKLGGERSRVLGVKSPDIESDWFVAEVKDYQKAPRVIGQYLRWLHEHCDGKRRHFFIFRDPYDRKFILCERLDEFEDWHGKVRPPGGSPV